MIIPITELGGYPVHQFDPASTGQVDLSASALRFGMRWDALEESDVELWDQLNAIVKHPSVETLPGLGLGVWANYIADSSQVFQRFLIEHRGCFPALDAMFLGLDLTDSLNKVRHGDVSPLISAFPGLKFFGLRGSCDLELSPIRHVCLEALVIEGAGLSKAFMEGLEHSILPELTRLELWIGSEDYGYDGSLANFESLFSGELFPKLKHLGLRNAVNVDEIASALKGAWILDQIETLDLSLGWLTDEGARHLLENSAVKELDQLDIHWHYLSEEMLKRFSVLGPVSINASQPDYQSGEIEQFKNSNDSRGGIYLENYYHHQYDVVKWPY